MAIATDLVKQEKAKKELSPAQKSYGSLESYLKKNIKMLEEALPKHMTAERLTRTVLTACRQNPKLLTCSQASLIGAVLQSAQLGIEPTALGHAYFVPYWSGKTKSHEVQFQIGYKGLLELVRRTGQIQNIYAQTVYENDEFEYEYGINEKLSHKPSLTERGEVKCFYAFAKFKDGGHSFFVMSIQDIENIKKRSKTSTSGPWITDYEAMAKKTVIKQLCKYLPISVEFEKAIVSDETTKSEYSSDMALDIQDETDWDSNEVETEIKVEEVNAELDKEEKELSENIFNK